MPKIKLKKGDEVIVTSGKNKGKKGTIIKIIPKTNKAIVSGVNLVKKHIKPTQYKEGGIEQKELPLNISNVAFIDPKTGKATRIGYKILEDGTKVRIARKSGEIISEEGK